MGSNQSKYSDRSNNKRANIFRKSVNSHDQDNSVRNQPEALSHPSSKRLSLKKIFSRPNKLQEGGTETMSSAQSGGSNSHHTQSATQNNQEGRLHNKRRRTQSNTSPGDSAEHEEVKGSQSMLRRLRRRVHTTEDEVEEVTSGKQRDRGKTRTVNKGKEKEKEDVIMKDESSSESVVNSTEVNLGQTNLSDCSPAKALEPSNGESSSAQSMPSSATQTPNAMQSLDTPSSSSNVDGVPSQTESSDQRHNRMRREIEQSLATAGTNQQ
ncbi:uncharacterized protein FA14DRAFT_78212 [Meira miltonrushii]|uniref:Uncharacterized protein n=1 Tax=Meira miltonrushii TaxID=1280837 RepID=A0A316V5I3_9BASI|nr:uncharacterized protein FA14DRAFT_78212 [Meira miltonrushii]PWN32810.1 hypothetical protein FA14DRAFT_78212 [Meira miltonrushii]